MLFFCGGIFVLKQKFTIFAEKKTSMNKDPPQKTAFNRNVLKILNET